MLILFGNKDLIQKYSYCSLPIEELVDPKHYGLDDTWYGGNMSCIAKLRNSQLLVIVSKSLQTLDVGIEEINLNKLDKETCDILKGLLKTHVESKRTTSKKTE